MTSFSIHIMIDDEQHQFLFTHVLHPTCTKYFVTVKGKLLTAFFEMKRAGQDEWKILPPAPAWVLSHEKQLIGLVEQKTTGCTDADSPNHFNSLPQTSSL